MANYCSNSVTYYSDNQGQILNLYLRLRGATESLGGMEMGSIQAKRPARRHDPHTAAGLEP